MAPCARLSDPRRLSTIARSEAPDAIRVEALAQTQDERALSGIARLAKNEATALAALERLTDAAELVGRRPEQRTPRGRPGGVRARHRAGRGRGAGAGDRSTEPAESRQPARPRRRSRTSKPPKQSRRAAEEERRRRELAACEAVERLADADPTSRAHGPRWHVSAEEWSSLDVTDAALARPVRARRGRRRDGHRARGTRNRGRGRTGPSARRSHRDARCALRPRRNARRRRRPRATASDRRGMAIADPAHRHRPGGRSVRGAIRQGGGCVPQAARDGSAAGRDARPTRRARRRSRGPDVAGRCCGGLGALAVAQPRGAQPRHDARRTRPGRPPIWTHG